MPTITLTRAASSSGTNGWFAVSDEDAVKYQYNANATLGGQGIEITEIRIHGRAKKRVFRHETVAGRIQTGAEQQPEHVVKIQQQQRHRRRIHSG